MPLRAPGQLSYFSLDDAISGEHGRKTKAYSIACAHMYNEKPQISSSNAQFSRKTKTISHKASLTETIGALAKYSLCAR